MLEEALEGGEKNGDDGGKTWATADRVKVKGADGKERAAGLSELTHIRWTQRGELAPGKQGEAGFRVVVN